MKLILKLFLILLMLSQYSVSLANDTTKYPTASLNGPRATMNYFLKTMKGYKLGDKSALALAALSFSNKLKQNEKETAAINLIQVFDKLEYINVLAIPETESLPIWVYLKKSIKVKSLPTSVEIVLIKENDKKWRFTRSTFISAPILLDSLNSTKVINGVVKLNRPMDKIKSYFPDWTGDTYLLIKTGQWFALLLIILIALIANKSMQFYFNAFIKKVFGPKLLNIKYDHTLNFGKTIGNLIFWPIWISGIQLIELSSAALSVLNRIGKVGFTIAAVLAATKLVDMLALYMQKVAKDSENKFDDILVPLITKTIKTFVIAFGIIFIGDSLTLDMKGILTGLGIGGIAFALAAKDTISNLFGSLTVLLDRPFSIGDWVLIDGKIEGTVEQVGLRSTKIRTFYDSLISLPNGMLTNSHIDNYGQRTYRRYNSKIGIEYSTHPDKVEAFCEGIKEIIHSHPYTRKDYFHVYFNGFGDSSLQILVYVFWQVPDWSKELEEKHRFLLSILKLGNDMGVGFAFPTRTLHIQSEDLPSHPEQL